MSQDDYYLSTNHPMHSLSKARQSVLVLILGSASLVVSLAPNWIVRAPVDVDQPAFAVRVLTSLLMAWAMITLERRRVTASHWNALMDGLLIAVIVVVAANIGASEAFVAQIQVRTVAILVGTPALFVLAHALVAPANER